MCGEAPVQLNATDVEQTLSFENPVGESHYCHWLFNTDYQSRIDITVSEFFIDDIPMDVPCGAGQLFFYNWRGADHKESKCTFTYIMH